MFACFNSSITLDRNDSASRRTTPSFKSQFTQFLDGLSKGLEGEGTLAFNTKKGVNQSHGILDLPLADIATSRADKDRAHAYNVALLRLPLNTHFMKDCLVKAVSDTTFWHHIVWRHISPCRHMCVWRHILRPHCLTPHFGSATAFVPDATF